MEISGQGIFTQKSAEVTRGNGYMPENTQVSEGKQAEAPEGKTLFLNSLDTGSFVYGQVQSSSTDSAVLLLDNGQKLLAKLTEGVSLAPGEQVAFQVQGKKEGMVYLKPLFNQGQLDAAAGKALRESGFMNTPRNQEIVRELLENNMPVDKNSIRSMLKKTAQNPDVSVRQLILMEKLDLPITREKIAQLQQYEAGEHPLEKQMDGLMEELEETTGRLLEEGRTQEAADLNQKAVNLFLSQLEETETETPEALKGAEAQGEVGTHLEERPVDLPESNTNQGSRIQEQDGQRTAEGERVAGERAAGEPTEGSLPEPAEKKPAAVPEQAEVFRPEDAVGKEGAAEKTAEGFTKAKSEAVLTPETESAVSDTKTERGIKEELLQMKETLARANTPEETETLLKSSSFRETLEKAMKEAWQIKPQEFQGKESVEKSYARMEEQTRTLGELIREAGTEYAEGTKSTVAFGQNAEFIQDLNQVFPYIQLPLQLAGESAHGDLYVFQDGKRQRAQGEPVTAFLHLNMEHLGDVDVYLRLQQEQVSADITLEREDILDLFEAHIEELTDRLEEKGYQVHTALQTGEKMNFTEDILAKEAGRGTLSRYSFDVKA